MKRTSYTKKLVSLALALVMALAMTIPAFATRYTADNIFEMYRDIILSQAPEVLCKLPTDLDPTPTAEDLNLDPLSYWHEIIPVAWGVDGGDDSKVEKTTRPAAEIYQELKQLVNELTADKTTVADKYTAIYMWEESNIHYELINRTNNIYLVYERGYGACAEKSYMLYIMATLAGIKAAVLTGGNHQSTVVMDENGKWAGEKHDISELSGPAECAYYTDGLDQYRCDLETGEIKKLRTFTVKEPEKPILHAAFDDVSADAWYADAVDWAVARGIVNGTSETTFSPLEPCTGAQVITMLYRAEGSPDYSYVKLDYTPQNSWAVNALKWCDAYHINADIFYFDENDGRFHYYFDENESCTRIRAVNHIWRANGTPGCNYKNTFTDLGERGRAFEKSVNWAVSRGIVNGTSETTFSPDLVCDRATIVTMLYRAYGME